MNRHRRLLMGAAGITCGAALISREAPCEEQHFPAVISPDGARRALIFRRACGEAAPIRTHVSVLPAHEEPAGEGNVFTMEVMPHPGGGGYDFEVLWTGADRLLIRHLPYARVLRAEPRIGSVRIEYRDGTENP